MWLWWAVAKFQPKWKELVGRVNRTENVIELSANYANEFWILTFSRPYNHLRAMQISAKLFWIDWNMFNILLFLRLSIFDVCQELLLLNLRLSVVFFKYNDDVVKWCISLVLCYVYIINIKHIAALLRKYLYFNIIWLVEAYFYMYWHIFLVCRWSKK